jgi:hypothetical protein
MRTALQSENILGEIDFRDPRKHNPEAKAAQACAWARDIITKAE